MVTIGLLILVVRALSTGEPSEKASATASERRRKGVRSITHGTTLLEYVVATAGNIYLEIALAAARAREIERRDSYVATYDRISPVKPRRAPKRKF